LHHIWHETSKLSYLLFRLPDTLFDCFLVCFQRILVNIGGSTPVL